MATSAHDLKTGFEMELAAAKEPSVERMPLAQYLSASFRPDREWIAGVLLERHVGEGSHAVIQKFLAMYLGVREEQWGILVRTEQRVQVSADRYRIPDVCVTRADETFEEIVHRPPLLCVEILSPEDTATELLERIEDYRTMGVPVTWMIDPRRRRASMVDGRGNILQVQEQLTVPGTAIQLTLNDLFAQLNRLTKPS